MQARFPKYRYSPSPMSATATTAASPFDVNRGHMTWRKYPSCWETFNGFKTLRVCSFCLRLLLLYHCWKVSEQKTTLWSSMTLNSSGFYSGFCGSSISLCLLPLIVFNFFFIHLWSGLPFQWCYGWPEFMLHFLWRICPFFHCVCYQSPTLLLMMTFIRRW